MDEDASTRRGQTRIKVSKCCHPPSGEYFNCNMPAPQEDARGCLGSSHNNRIWYLQVDTINESL